MDGYGVAKAIRKLEVSSAFNVPIIGLTAHAVLDVHSQCEEAGMNDVISKPLSEQSVKDMVRKYIYCVD